MRIPITLAQYWLASCREWYGVTRTFYPQPAKVEDLVKHFPNIDSSYVATMEFPQGGETMEHCHSRVEACVNQIISRLDSSPHPVGTVVFVCHAASMICLGRALLKDSKAFIPSATCSCSTFKRSDASAAWTMHNEGDTSFLSGGEQHAWQFEGDVPNYERTSGGPLPASPTTTEPQTVSPALSADIVVP
jgi:Histidine phosphatase superfamily (branch 1)